MDHNERDDLIRALHNLGMSQTDILHSLAQYGIVISQRHLRRILKKLNLYRRIYSDIENVVLFIQREISSSGMLHGYRWMYHKCMLNGYNVRKEDVRLILYALDPEGSAIRQARRLHRRTYYASGPHYIWHLDGYDKLKPYGFGIHGCIDGFSRRLMWLNVYMTNSDPRIIAGYFVEALQENSGCPRVVRADPGTENVHVRQIQEALMGNGRNEHHTSYIEGSSTLNQRIESFWGHLRKECIEYWICLFHDLKEIGDFVGDFIDTNLAQFCFLGIIQMDLDAVTAVWNSHIIRQCRPGLPSGRPNIMFEAPFLYGTHSYLTNIHQHEINAAKELCTFRDPIPCDTDMYELCCHIMNENGLQYPKTPEDSVHLYLSLRENVRNQLNT